MWSRYLFGALAVLAAIVIYDVAVIARALFVGSQLASESTPYSSADAAMTRSFDAGLTGSSGKPAKPGRLARVLVVGDSTAVGTGAGDAALSVPGRLASDYPGVVLENRAQDGARTAAAVDQMRDAASHSYALVLVLVGGNDVLQLTPTAALHKAISEVLQEAAGLGEHVVLMTVGDVGSAPAVPWPISMLLSRRAAELRSVFAEEAERRGVSYLDMYVPDGRRDPFARDPGTFYARDGLHPSAAGYGLWYQHLEREAPLQRWLSAP